MTKNSPSKKSSPHCGILFSMYENPMGQLCYWKWSFLTYKLLSACRLCLLVWPHFCCTLSHILQDHDLLKTNKLWWKNYLLHTCKILTFNFNSLFQKWSKTFFIKLNNMILGTQLQFVQFFNFYANVSNPSFFNIVVIGFQHKGKCSKMQQKCKTKVWSY